MQVIRRTPDFALSEQKATYLVRVWKPGSEPFAAWAVDDWEIVEAGSIVDVVDWAVHEKSENGVLEIFAKANGTDDWMRIHGGRPDDAEAQTKVPLVL